MPRIHPIHPHVRWPEQEGIIGVVGVAPWATVDFMYQIYKSAIATKDWHFPRILVDANSKIPSRGRYFDLGESDPSPYIAETINELITSGATVVVVPCNTAHILFDRWSKQAFENVISIVDATLAELSERNMGSLAVLSSSHLVRHRTYLDPIGKMGFECRNVSHVEQDLIGQVIGEIKVNMALTDATEKRFASFLEDLQHSKVGTLILGCTELAEAMRCVRNNVFKGIVIDSNAALARAALKRVMA